MSCFLVPMTQAVVTSVIRKHQAKSIDSPEASAFKRHLPTLEKMLWLYGEGQNGKSVPSACANC